MIADAEIGMVGLGVMGRNLLLNMADKGFAVAGYDREFQQQTALQEEAGARRIHVCGSLVQLVQALRVPRTILLLVPAGAAVDTVIQELLPLVSPGDLLIDGGNSHFKDSDRRAKQIGELGLSWLGVGVSGGETGARKGPSLMAGGTIEAYARVKRMFETVAAQVDQAPCAALLGSGSAGHYVKMVHNGIEYGLMQLLAEAYHLMKQGLSLSNDELSQIFTQWEHGKLGGFLVEITAKIMAQADPATKGWLIDAILDEAGQKGTGAWAAQEALELQVPVPTLQAAVMVRELSVRRSERTDLGSRLGILDHHIPLEREIFLKQLHTGLHAASLLCYLQGFTLLAEGSSAHAFDLDLERIASVWRGGCIIRSALLPDIAAAFARCPKLANLLQDRFIGQEVASSAKDLAAVVGAAASASIPVPGLMASLSVLELYRAGWLPANLIQAQRDFFGAHTYRRRDTPGTFHTQWRDK